MTDWTVARLSFQSAILIEAAFVELRAPARAE